MKLLLENWREYLKEEDISRTEEYVKHTALNLGMVARNLVGRHDKNLKVRLEEIFNEGLEKRWRRHIDNALYTRNWALERGQSLFPEKGFESATITCIQNDMNWDIDTINELLLERSFRMDRGYGKLRGKAFRIAHMGNVKDVDLIDYLNIFDEVLNG